MVPNNLLELNMCYDISQELKVGANAFLKKLVQLLNLDFAGCWQKEDKASNNCTPIFVYPLKTKCSVIQNQDFFHFIEEQDFSIINEGHHYSAIALQSNLVHQGNVLVFNTPFLIIYLYRKQESFREEEGQFFYEQIKRFSDYAKLAFEHGLFQDNIKAYKTREKILLSAEEKSQKENLVVKNELLEAQTIMEIMFKNMEDGVFIYNYIEERIIETNDAALRMFGYDNRKEMIGISRMRFVPQFSKYFPGVDMHEYTRGHGIKVSNGENIDKTLGIFAKKNDDHFFVEANVIPTHRKKGEAFIIFQDTTERFWAQKELKLREKKYRQIFENSHEAIIYIDLKKKRVFDCNQQALKLFEIDDKKEFINSNFSDFFPEGKNGVCVNEYFEEKINTAVRNGNSNFQLWAHPKSKNFFRAEGNIIVEMRKNKVRRTIIFLRDITDKYNAKIKLQAQHQKLKKYIESNLQLENFAYLASHDLQTPLRTIISFTQLLQRNLKEKLNQTEHEYMSFILRATKDMKMQIQDLLDFSLVNNTSINVKKINVTELLRSLLKGIEFDIKKKKAIINLPKEPIYIKADEFKLKQLFQNLLTNALKFVKPTTNPVVHITFEDRKNKWCFFVEDNGIGIEKEYEERVFLLFKRLHGKDEYEGTGIGLAICKKIVEQHQGEIGYESQGVQGTTFYFTIKKEILSKEILS